MTYNTLHDQKKIITLVGNTFMNRTLFEYFRQQRPVEQVSLEDAVSRDEGWFLDRQFFCGANNIDFKKIVADKLSKKNASWISVISTKSDLSPDAQIGGNVFVNHFTVILDDAKIGDHCTVAPHAMLSHGVEVGPCSHIAPYCYLCFSRLGQGSCLGLRSTFTAKKHSPIQIADWCNFYVDSRVTASIDKSGTYFGQRLIGNANSLELNIL